MAKLKTSDGKKTCVIILCMSLSAIVLYWFANYLFSDCPMAMSIVSVAMLIVLSSFMLVNSNAKELQLLRTALTYNTKNFVSPAEEQVEALFLENMKLVREVIFHHIRTQYIEICKLTLNLKCIADIAKPTAFWKIHQYRMFTYWTKVFMPNCTIYIKIKLYHRKINKLQVLASQLGQRRVLQIGL